MSISEHELEFRKCMSRMQKIQLHRIHRDLNPADFNMLMVISDSNEEGIRVSQLAKYLDVPMPAISRGMRSLENRGYIQRNVDPKDRRNVYVYLTEKGKQKCQQAKDEFHVFWMALFADRDPKDMDSMLKNWNEIIDKMELVLQECCKKN